MGRKDAEVGVEVLEDTLHVGGLRQELVLDMSPRGMRRYQDEKAFQVLGNLSSRPTGSVLLRLEAKIVGGEVPSGALIKESCKIREICIVDLSEGFPVVEGLQGLVRHQESRFVVRDVAVSGISHDKKRKNTYYEK